MLDTIFSCRSPRPRGDGTMTTTGILRVHVRQFFEFEGAFESYREPDVAPDEQHARSIGELLCQCPDSLSGVEHQINFAWHVT